MKKNKFLVSLAAFSLLFGFALAACGGAGDNPSSKPAAQEKITITAAEGKKSLILGETVQLTASVSGVTWSSTNAEVASVNDAGLVTSLSKGTTNIKAVKQGYRDGSIAITVDYETIHVSVEAGGKTSLLVGETVQLTADKQGVTWASSDDSVATVADGLVTAKKVGSATITASGTNLNPGSQIISVVRPEPTAVLHMEDASHYSADGWWGTTSSSSLRGPITTPVYSPSSGSPSDSKCVAYLGEGDIETLTFTSDKACKAELVLMIGYYYSIDDLRTSFGVKFNNADLVFAQQGYEAEGTSSYTYKELSFGEVELINGTNKLEITMLEGAQYYPYIDDLNIYAAEAANIVAVPAIEPAEIDVDSKAVELNAGKQHQIVSSDAGLSYFSTKTSVATVGETGLITAVDEGTAEIIVVSPGLKAVRIAITVKPAVGVIALGINEGTSEGDVVKTRTSQNLSEPYNYIVDEWPEGAILTFNFTVEIAGNYNLFMKARASGGYNSTTTDDLATCMELKVNGNVVTLNQTVSGSFTEYNLGVINLTAGPATMTIEAKGTVPTINMFKFIPVE